MTIVKKVKDELPEEGADVFCDSGKLIHRATFKGGKFIAGDFPMKIHTLKNVTKWFYPKDYSDHFKSKGSYEVSFERAEFIDSGRVIDVTNSMVHAAIKQAVKDGILPTHADMDTYTHHRESMERIIEKALEKQGQEL